ncbi:1-hydroxy-2-methyl-2-(E)-butenyl 4-diphosphate reductase [Alphaproteobacteria bacterium]
MKIVLAEPRGFCAGVKRAIEIVEQTILKHGKPVYVRHEIVHNQYVVNALREKGAIFVDDLSQIPSLPSAVVVFSAHGVSEKIENEAKKSGLRVIDATCPLVKKIHTQTQHYENCGKKIILIGHAGHAEVEGTRGRMRNQAYLVQKIEDITTLPLNPDDEIAYITQTTLNIDDTKNIIEELRKKFKNLEGPELNNICYATQNRQRAVKFLSGVVDLVLVIGAENSSNSNRLVEIAKTRGVMAYLIDDETQIDLSWLQYADKVGITAGASAPEILVSKVIRFLKQHAQVDAVETLAIVEENIQF